MRGIRLLAAAMRHTPPGQAPGEFSYHALAAAALMRPAQIPIASPDAQAVEMTDLADA